MNKMVYNEEKLTMKNGVKMVYENYYTIKNVDFTGFTRPKFFC